MLEKIRKLINALTGNEKRYLKVHILPELPERFTKLFDAIAKHDKTALNALKGGKSSNQSADLAKLQEKIFQGMRQYRRNRSLSIQVRELLEDARFLHEKNLKPLAQQRLEKAIDLAEQDNNLLGLLEIELSKHLLEKRIQKGQNLMEGLTEKNKRFQEFLLYASFWFFLQQTHQKKKHVLDPEEQEELKAQIPASHYESHKTPKQAGTVRRFLQGSFFYHFLLDMPEKMVESGKALLKWWQDRPDMIPNNLHLYLRDLGNCAHLSIQINKLDFAFSVMKVFDGIKTRNKSQKNKLIEMKYSTWLFFLLNTKDTDTSEWIIQMIKTKLLPQKNIRISMRQTLLVNIALYYFKQYNFTEALAWAEKTRETLKQDPSQQVVAIINRIALIATLESPTEKFRDIASQATTDYFQLLKLSPHHHEIQFVDLLTEIDRASRKNLSRLRPHYIKLQQFVKALDNDNRLTNPGGINEILEPWLEKKIPTL